MTLLRIDARFSEDPKLDSLENDPRKWAEALAVWVAVGCYVSRYRADGCISRARLERLTPLRKQALKAADNLTKIGLLEKKNDGFYFRDFKRT